MKPNTITVFNLLFSISLWLSTAVAMQQPTQAITSSQQPNVNFVHSQQTATARSLDPMSPYYSEDLSRDFFTDPSGVFEEITATKKDSCNNVQTIGSIDFFYLQKEASSKNNYPYSGYIHLLFVDCNERKRGLGSTLLFKALNTMCSHGCTKVLLKAIPFGRQKLTQEQLNTFYSNCGGHKLPQTSPSDQKNFFVFESEQGII